MIKILFILLLVITSFLPFTVIEAVEVDDLYQASVAINSRNNTDRAIALKEALAAVMVKVGGNKSVLDNKIIKKSLNEYQRYLNQYRYHFNTDTAKTPIIDNQKQAEDLFLLASFNEDKINELFHQANLAIWGSLRPQVLLWLVNEDGLLRTIMSNSTDSPLTVMINDFSAQRGLPITMPLMDLDDITQITPSDLWGRFEQPIRKASSRYLAEAIVVMRISNSSLVDFKAKRTLKDQGYTLDWNLLGLSPKGKQKIYNQQYKGSDKAKLLQLGLADITDLIYQHYALTTTGSNEIIIEVANVDSLSTYVDVFDFLTDLSAVKSVTLLHAEGASRRFNLQLIGSPDALVASLTLNRQLKQDPLATVNNTRFDNEANEVAVPIFYWSN